MSDERMAVTLDALLDALNRVTSVLSDMKAIASVDSDADDSLPSTGTAWDSVDWTLTDLELSRLLGVTRQRVNQKRHKIGHPSVSLRERRHARLRLESEQKTIDEWAAEFEVARGTIHNDMTALNVRPAKVRRPRPNQWVADWDAVDWAGKTNAEIAEELGVTAVTVRRQRLEWNRPLGPHRWRPRKRREES